MGPPLHQKIDAPKRLKDPKYKGKAKTAREYVEVSLLNPDVYIVFNEKAGKLYPAGVMPQDYANLITARALELLVDFISSAELEEN